MTGTTSSVTKPISSKYYGGLPFFYSWSHPPPSCDDCPVNGPVFSFHGSTSQSTEVRLIGWNNSFEPRTSLGKKLHELRAKAIAEGMILIPVEEILEEVKRHRGETEGT